MHQEVRLLWHQGQQQLALQAVQQLVQEMTAGVGAIGTRAGSVDHGSVDPVQLAVALGLAGKWMSEVQQAGGGSTALDYLKRSADCLEGLNLTIDLDVGSRSAADREGVACKLLYRLALYADQRYKETVQQKASPEFARQVPRLDLDMYIGYAMGLDLDIGHTMHSLLINHNFIQN